MDFGVLDGCGFKRLLGIPRYDTHDIDVLGWEALGHQVV
jgi:hypothetical protein